MKIVKAHTPQWANKEHTLINMWVQFEELPTEVPFTADAGDIEAHGKELFTRAQAWEFGPIAEFV